MTDNGRPVPWPDWNSAPPDVAKLINAAERTLERDATAPPRRSAGPIPPNDSSSLSNFEDRRAQQAGEEQLAEQAEQAGLRLDQLRDARSHVRWRRRRRVVFNVLSLALLAVAAVAATMSLETTRSVRLAALCAMLVLTGGGGGTLIASWALDHRGAKKK